MASAFSNQFTVLLILLLFLVETAAIKCYQQPGVDPRSIGRKTPVDEEVRLYKENKDKWIELDCDNFMDSCVVGIGCKSPLPTDALSGVFELRGCAFSKTEHCKEMQCKGGCRTCEGDLCNGGNVAALSSMLMIAVGFFVAFVPFMIG